MRKISCNISLFDVLYMGMEKDYKEKRRRGLLIMRDKIIRII